ncbi:MAG: hypothetical protein AAGG48_28545 [Planctomycetota bacterium]
MAYLFLIAAAFCFALLFVACERNARERRVGFSSQPCISDEEFCALIPDVPLDVALKVRDVLVDVTGWDREEIHPDTRLVEFELW